MAKRKQYDWEAIEREYRAGQLSLREIARVYGCSDTAIRKKAKANGWERDLSAKVRAKVRTKLVRDKVRTQALSEKEIVEVAAETGFQVSALHRKDIKRFRKLANKLLAELEGQTDGAEVLGQARSALKQGDMGVLAAAVQKITALPERIKGASLLAGTLKNLITLERQAFNLDEERGTGNIAGAVILLEPQYVTGDNAERD